LACSAFHIPTSGFDFDGKEFFIVSAHGPEAALEKNAADIASILASIKAAK